MPVYDIEHIVSLTDGQKDQLADAITKVHSEKFSTPRLFVNVNFKDISSIRTYVGGKHRPNNRIIANVRHGKSRTQELYDELCSEIAESWKSVVGNSGEQELRAIFVLGSIVAGYEAGFSIPQAGQDGQWLKEYLPQFQKKADDGDEDFQALIEDVRTRPAFKEFVN